MNESYFGKSYSHTGDINSDFLIKTRGDVIVQCNRKFVKLISGGRLNVDYEFIFEVDSVDDISSGKDGIYYTEDGNIYIKIGDDVIALTSEDNSGDFVSYIQLQGINDFKIVQQNIGLLQENVNSLDKNVLPSDGVLFDNTTHKFYYIDKNKELIPLGFEIPELIKHNIKIDGSSPFGSLALLGKGKNKGLSIGDTIYIYATDNDSFLDSSKNITINIGNHSIFKITDEGIILSDQSKIVTNLIESSDGNFKLVDERGESTLFVDNIVTKQNEVTYDEAINLILNEKLIPKKKYTIIDFQNEWEIQEDGFLIHEDIYDYDDENEDFIYLDEDKKIKSIKFNKNVRKLILTANSNNSFLIDGYYEDGNYKVQYDITPKFLEDPIYPDEDDGGELEYTLDPMYKGVITKLTDSYNNSANYDFKNLRFYNKEKDEWYYTFNNPEEEYNIDYSESGFIYNNNIELKNPIYYKKFIFYDGNIEDLESLDITNDSDIELNISKNDIIKEGNYIIFNKKLNNTTINDIIDDNIIDVILEFVTFDNLEKVVFEKDLKYVSFHGNINKDIFKESEYPLLYDNTKQKEVYRNGDRYDVIFIPDLIIPSGLIAMWFRDEIPSGWVICDGTNNTPDLIDKFIKGSIKAGEEGGSNEVIITEDNLPNHKHGIKFDISSNPSEKQDTNFKHTHDISTSLSSMTPSSTDLKPLMFPATTSKNIETSSVDISGSISGGINDIEILPTGKGIPIKIEPKYYSMIYIMKL